MQMLQAEILKNKHKSVERHMSFMSKVRILFMCFISWCSELVEKVFGKKTLPSRTFRFVALQLQMEIQKADHCIFVGMSSPGGYELSTNTALLLSHALQSEINAKVLLVDATFQSQVEALSARLGFQEYEGFTDVLAASEPDVSMIYKTAVNNVYCMPIGSSHHANLSGVDSLRQLKQLASESFDIVILQLNSPEKDTRALSCARQSDINFLVVKEGVTLMNDIDSIKELFQANDIGTLRLIVSEN